MYKFDPEEQALLDAFESGILMRVENVDLDRQRHKVAATSKAVALRPYYTLHLCSK